MTRSPRPVLWPWAAAWLLAVGALAAGTALELMSIACLGNKDCGPWEWAFVAMRALPWALLVAGLSVGVRQRGAVVALVSVATALYAAWQLRITPEHASDWFHAQGWALVSLSLVAPAARLALRSSGSPSRRGLILDAAALLVAVAGTDQELLQLAAVALLCLSWLLVFAKAVEAPADR